MAVKAYWYINYFKQAFANSPAYGGWQPNGGDTFRIALCPPSYQPNQDTQTSFSQVVEVSGQGYTAGGQILTGKTISASTGVLVLGANPASWSGCVFTARYAVIYDDSNPAAVSKQLVKWIDFGQNLQLAGNTLELTFDGDGTVTVSPPPSDTTPPELDLTMSVSEGPILTLAYDELLDTTSVPATSAFAVLVNGVARTVSSVSVSSFFVNLNLASTVANLDTVTAAYTVPASNPIRDLAFNPAASFTAQDIPNTTAPPPVDVTPPVLQIAAINGNSLTLTYDELLNTASLPATTDFTVKTDGNTRSLSSVGIVNSQVLINLATAVLASNVVTITYVLGVNVIEDRAGNNAAALTNQAVTNATPGDTTAPSIVSLIVDTSTLTVKYNENMDTGSVPSTSAFAITVNSVARSVSTVAISGQNVTLTLASPVVDTNTVLASYTQPATGKLRDVGQNNAASFFNLSVTNVTSPGPPPTDLASFVSQSVPSLTMTTSSTQNVSVTMRNDGTASWSSQAGYHLYSQSPAGNTNWSFSQVPVAGNILPSNNAPFNFQITAPATAGTYPFQWRMRHTSTEFGSQSQSTSIVVSVPQSSGNTYYIAPNGSDSASGTSPLIPWKTFAYANSRLNPGDTLRLLNGTYLTHDSNGNVVNGSFVLSNKAGTLANPITIRAENERQAFILSGNGAVPYTVSGCSYIISEGIYVSNVDKQIQGQPGGHTVRAVSSNNLTFRRMLVTRNNRFLNGSIFIFESSSYCLAEECEAYWFHRNGLAAQSSLSSSHHNTFRRCYSNSRDYEDIAGGYPSSPTTKGDTGFLVYPGSNNLFENCIAEGSSIGFDIEAPGTAVGNLYYGNIAYGCTTGFNATAREGSGIGFMPRDTVIENFVSIGSTSIGMYLRANKNTTVRQVSVLNGTGVQGFAADSPSSAPGDGAPTFFGTNILSFNNVGTGLSVSNAYATWTLTSPNSFANSSAYSPAVPNSHVTNPLTTNPLLNGILVWIPAGTPMKGAGSGGDIGANVLYRYQDGVITTQRLWNTDGTFPHGATVLGVNDSSLVSLVNVNTRLNVTAANLPY